ncbi:MAG: hypothetical protein R3F17_11460 [Planctomycetota bacterium]
MEGGCLNSSGHGAHIEALGSSSVEKGDLRIEVEGLPARVPTYLAVGLPGTPMLWF